MTLSVVGGEGDTDVLEVDAYSDRLREYLAAYSGIPAEGELATRTLGPRDQETSGEADVALVVQAVEAAALVGETPLMSSHALLCCAASGLTDGWNGEPSAPVFIAANDPLCRDHPFPFVSSSFIDRLLAGGERPLVLVDCVHGCDPAGTAVAAELLERWPQAPVVAACDRQAALALRRDGFRPLPVWTTASRRRGADSGGDELAALAASAVDQDGDPLAITAPTKITAGLAPPLARSSSGDLVMVRDLDRYAELLGRRLAEDPASWRWPEALPAEILCRPDFGATLATAAVRASELGVAEAWLTAQLDVLDLNSHTSVQAAAVVVGALIANAGFSLDWLGESHAECLAGLAGLRDPVLRQAAADDRLGVAIPSLAAGFDRCQAAVSASPDAECETSFIDGVGEVPVTVPEFARFVDGGGYEDERWWAEFPFAFGRWREPREWKRQISNPTNPVTGVSWYEATAYANYLSQVEGPVWVASFAERRGVCGEPFPWGAEPATPARLNFDQHIGEASPVGAYRLGIGLAGHADLAGNVWEWCSDLPDDESAIVCGGGWYTATEYVKSDYRYAFHRSNRFDDLGFRIAQERSRA